VTKIDKALVSLALLSALSYEYYKVRLFIVFGVGFNTYVIQEICEEHTVKMAYISRKVFQIYSLSFLNHHSY